MKWVLLAFASVTIVGCADDADVKFDDFESNYNKEFISYSDMMFGMNSESTVELAGNLTLDMDIPHDTRIDVNIYSKAGIQFLDKQDANYTDDFSNLLGQSFFPKMIYETSNFPNVSSEYIPGTYTIKNFQMTWQEIAKLLPPGTHKSRRLTYSLDSPSKGFISSARIDFTVEPKNKKKKPAGRPH